MNKQPVDSQPDDAIDRAVRDMMSVDAHAAFRGRVLARLGEARRPWLPWPRLAVVGAAVVAVLLAVFVVRRPPAAPPQQVSNTRPPEITTASPAQHRIDTAAPPSVHTIGVAKSTPDARDRSPARGMGRIEAADVDEVPPMAPLAVAELESKPIEPAAIEIAPLDPIAEVHITPLAASLDGIEERR
jgi:hypothetical protein